MSPVEVIEFAKKNGVKMVNFKFVDMPGLWQHLTIPLHQLEPEVFENGLMFDGSSIRGWRNIHESDMMIKPDPKTARIDPFMEVPTLSLLCDVHVPETGEPYNRDPRQIAKKAMAYLKSLGIADTAFFGPEAEFFIFDDIRYEQNQNSAFYQIDSDEAHWNTGRDEGKNLGYKTRPKEGYFPALPHDTHHDLRTEICLEMEKVGMIVERQHHEVASAGQGEINFRFDKMIETADNLMWFKYIVKNVARRHGKAHRHVDLHHQPGPERQVPRAPGQRKGTRRGRLDGEDRGLPGARYPAAARMPRSPEAEVCRLELSTRPPVAGVAWGGPPQRDRERKMTDYELKTVGSRLRYARHQTGLSLRSLSEKLKVSVNTIGAYERNETSVDVEVLQYFAAQGFNVHWLVTGEGADLLQPSQALPTQTLRIEIAVVSRDPVTFNFVPGVNRDEQDESPKD